MKRKRYSRKFQRMAVERLRTCDGVRELAQELGMPLASILLVDVRRPIDHHAAYQRANLPRCFIGSDQSAERGTVMVIAADRRQARAGALALSRIASVQSC